MDDLINQIKKDIQVEFKNNSCFDEPELFEILRNYEINKVLDNSNDLVIQELIKLLWKDFKELSFEECV